MHETLRLHSGKLQWSLTSHTMGRMKMSFEQGALTMGRDEQHLQTCTHVYIHRLSSVHAHVNTKLYLAGCIHHACARYMQKHAASLHVEFLRQVRKYVSRHSSAISTPTTRTGVLRRY